MVAPAFILYTLAADAAAVLVTAVLPVAAQPVSAQVDQDDDKQGAPITEMVVFGRRLDAAQAKVDPSVGASTYTLSKDTFKNRPMG